MARVNLHVPDDFLEEIDRRAAALNVSRTSFIIMSLSQVPARRSHASSAGNAFADRCAGG